MSLQVAIYDQPDGYLLADLSPRLRQWRFTKNRHGCAYFTGWYPTNSLYESFHLLARPGYPHLQVTDEGMIVWAGRLEDVALEGGGVRLGAFGYWNALSDAPYTALWSTTKVSQAFQPTGAQHSAYSEQERFYFDNNNRLFIGLTKNTAYTLSKTGGWIWSVPDKGQVDIYSISLDYEFKASANVTFRVVSHDWSGIAFVNGAVENSIVGNGAVQSGSLSITLAAVQNLVGVDLLINTGHTYAGENSAEYLKVTNVRIKTATDTTVRAGTIMAFALNLLNVLNPTQISASAALIQNTNLDLRDELYEDADIGALFDYLASLGDDQVPPRTWEVGVNTHRQLFFQPRSATRAWYVDVTEPDLSRTLEALRNSAYAVYQETGGRTLRTATAVDADSIGRFQVTRRAAVPASTTSATQAAVTRDRYLTEHKDALPRIQLMVRQLYGAAGERWPRWMAEPGQTVTMRNLPPTLGAEIDRLRTFWIAEVEYDGDNDLLSITPEAPLPQLAAESPFQPIGGAQGSVVGVGPGINPPPRT